MGKKLQRFSIDEHVSMGKRLKGIQDELNDILNTIWKSYGKSSRAGKAILRLADGSAIKNVCSEMDEEVIRETTRDLWDNHGWGWIYMGGTNKHTDFIVCGSCGLPTLRERLDETGVCALCYVSEPKPKSEIKTF